MFHRTSSILCALAIMGTLPGSLATLQPATSNTKGKCPSTNDCAPQKTSQDIQAAECAHNTRTHGQETYAIWKRTKTNSNGISYGSCAAYTCTAPTKGEMVTNDACWTFFWSSGGAQQGVGTGCIRDPNSGECGCENSDGQFIVGSDSCS